MVLRPLFLTYAVATALMAGCVKEPPASPAPSANYSKLQAYELSERCGRTAREWFKQFYGNGLEVKATEHSHSVYSNHFSTDKGRCYALVSISGEVNHSMGPTDRLQSNALFDVNENKKIGEYVRVDGPNAGTTCAMNGEDCKDVAGWQKSAAPYMTE